jgi:hypothetical protein
MSTWFEEKARPALLQSVEAVCDQISRDSEASKSDEKEAPRTPPPATTVHPASLPSLLTIGPRQISSKGTETAMSSLQTRFRDFRRVLHDWNITKLRAKRSSKKSIDFESV